MSGCELVTPNPLGTTRGFQATYSNYTVTGPLTAGEDQALPKYSRKARYQSGQDPGESGF